MLRRASAGVLAIALLAGGSSTQTLDPILPLPKLERCTAVAHPRLPDRWRAAFLMAPFTQAQLVLADLVHDEKIPATRVKLYGVRHGAGDFLIAGNDTFVIDSTASGVECRNLGDTGWRPLPPDWLTPGRIAPPPRRSVRRRSTGGRRLSSPRQRPIGSGSRPRIT